MIALFLLSVFLLQTFDSVLVYAQYLLNREFIAATLCENRDMPEMQCDGKCYLRKQLQQHHEEKDSPASPREERRDVTLFSPVSEPLAVFIKAPSRAWESLYQPVFSEKHTHAVFHPPANVS